MDWSNDPGRQHAAPGATGQMKTVSQEELPDLLKELAARHADDVLWITAIREDTGTNFQVRARVRRRPE
jgi:hypothetical protein